MTISFGLEFDSRLTLLGNIILHIHYYWVSPGNSAYRQS
jgi:hypothetical protein